MSEKSGFRISALVISLLMVLALFASCNNEAVTVPQETETERAVAVHISDETKTLLPTAGADVTHYRLLSVNESSSSRRSYDSGKVDRASAGTGGLFVNPNGSKKVLTGQYTFTLIGYVNETEVARDTAEAIINAKTESIAMTLETLSSAVSAGTKAIVKLPAELYAAITGTEGAFTGVTWTVSYWNAVTGTEAAALTGSGAEVLRKTGTSSNGTALGEYEVEVDLGLSLPTGSWSIKVVAETGDDTRTAREVVRAIPGQVSYGRLDMSNNALNEGLSVSVTNRIGDHIAVTTNDGVYAFNTDLNTGITITFLGADGDAAWYIDGTLTDKVTGGEGGVWNIDASVFAEEGVQVFTCVFIDPALQMRAGSVSFIVTALEGGGPVDPPTPGPDPEPEPDPEPTGKPASFMNIDPELDPSSSYIIVGYTDATKALTPVAWTSDTVLVTDFSGYGDGSKESYTTSELGLTPVYVTSVSAIAQTGATEITVGGGFSGNSSQSNSTVVKAKVAEGATTIKSYALYKFTALENVVLPESLTSIGSDSFGNCSSLTDINLKDTSITVVASSAFWYCTSLTGIELPTTVQSIGTSAFQGCSALTGIELPVAVESIGNYAFDGCSALSTLTIPSGSALKYLGKRSLVNTILETLDLSNCTQMTELAPSAGGSYDSSALFVDTSSSSTNSNTTLKAVILPSTITRISQNAFTGCRALTDVNIEDTFITTVEYNTFWYCISLTNIELPATVQSIANYAFQDCPALSTITIPAGSSLKYIGRGAFLNTALETLDLSKCTQMTELAPSSGGSYDSTSLFINASSSSTNSNTSLKTVILPSTITRISQDAFSGCRALTDINLKDTAITTIEYDTFRYCTALTGIELPTTVQSIGGSAFYGCSALTGIELPVAVESIGNYAFENCSALSTFTIPSGSTLKYLGKRSFVNTALETLDLSKCTQMTELAPSAGGSYDSSALFVDTSSSSTNSNTTLKAVILPSTITRISQNTFSNCRALTGINLKDTAVTAIEYDTFWNCTALTGIELPATVQSIGGSAFKGCTSLNTVTVPVGSSLKYLGNNVFAYTALETLDLSNCMQMTELAPSSGGSYSSSSYSPFSDSSGSSGYNTVLTSIILPSTITRISQNTFSNCRALTDINLKDTAVTAIEYDTFWFCTALTGIELPTTVQSIGGSAFYGCSALNTITISDSVTSIGSNAFNTCSALVSAVFEGTSGWTAGNTGLLESDLADPATAATYLKDTYKTSSWKRTI